MFSAVLAALGMCADGLGEGLYAVHRGYRARAMAIGFALAAILTAVTRVVTPLNFTVESVAVATQSVKRTPQIYWVVVLSAVPTAVLGLLGLYEPLIELFDKGVIAGAVAGVGIMLAAAGVDYIRDRRATGIASTVAGVSAFLLTDDLAVTVVAAIAAGALVARFLGPRLGDEPEEAEAPKVEKPRLIPFEWREMVSRPVLVGALSLFALRVGTVVSYDTVNSELAGTRPKLNEVFLVDGVASLAAGLFGGAPLEPTPSATAATEMPVFSAVLFLALMTAISAFGLVERMGRWVPLQSVAGFLIVIGVFVVLPDNIRQVNRLPDAVAMAVTAFGNPFYGIVAGEVIALLEHALPGA
ncbi:xanthine/uracil permease [Sphaerisporangium krabiense]|uniref:AGZA family xanthine/uracil permease-like MFS transporter n=1 Tax=Sphaerisporangium krabiense TaxID=763782 RepID=A0A7W9DPZ6_9ACTN|nr:solute carrier family 23 protein [Sphaerisporangium krabiense]MBB5625870.1 AGZA family xanthine/uracil permease-like MFS transporter [Sphaerisporangium krabiense]GII64672.1 xanthine/uracil permease [Sphaerisporangium krabiense]